MSLEKAIENSLKFTPHDIESAPGRSKSQLQKLINRVGFAPNLTRAMAESPVVLESYLELNALFVKSSTFNKNEQQCLFLVISRENLGAYCVAAHSFSAAHMRLPEEIIQAIRKNTPLPDKKLDILARITAQLVSGRGCASEKLTQEFIAAGYSKAQLLEIVLAIGIKLISNYTNNITQPELDPAFEGRRWTADDAEIVFN